MYRLRTIIDKKKKEKLIILVGKGKHSCYKRIVYESSGLRVKLEFLLETEKL